ncbi:MAG: hypothetical protein AB8B53_05305 [Flavobacteriales bacterium]
MDTGFKHILLTVLMSILALQYCNAQFYVGSQQEFGKNRVQYKTFDWLYYPADDVDVYFYNGGIDLAEYAVYSSKESLEEVQNLFDFTMEERVQLIIYNTQTDFRQSNVGIIDDNQDNIGGTTEIVGSKLFVYFDGDHGHFDTQIKAGLARVLFNQMMLGGNWKDVLRSSTFLTIPEWYREGIVSYAGDKWNAEADQYIRDGINTGLYSSFNELTGPQVRYCGHALWKYIADVYGESVIPNILYMTKISRNIEDGFLFVLGQDLATISEEFVEYWEKQFAKDKLSVSPPNINRLYTDKQKEKIEAWKVKDAEKLKKAENKYDQLSSKPDSTSFKKIKLLVDNWELLGYEGKKKRKLDDKFETYLGAVPVKAKNKYIYSQLKRSPDGEYLSFVTHEYGQYKVWLYHISSGKLKKLVKKDHKIDRIQDFTYPSTIWHPNGDILTFISEKQGRVWLNNYTLSTSKLEEKELFRIDKVIDMDYSDDGKKIVFSGVVLGQTDLYMYYVIGNNQTRITNDIYDDLYPSFLPDSEDIIFSSNRPDDTLRADVPIAAYPNSKDVFILRNGKTPKLERITNTPDVDEEHPEALNSKYYSYLAYKNGFKHQYAATVDSAISRIDTTIHYRYFTRETLLSNYSIQLKDYLINSKRDTYDYSFYKDNRQQFNWGYISEQNGVSPEKGSITSAVKQSEPKPLDRFTVVTEETYKPPVDPDNYIFESDKNSIEIEKEIVRIEDIQEKSDTTAAAPYQLPKSKKYRLNFVIDEVTTQLDNSLGFEMYQSLSPTSTINQGAGIGGMAKVSDLFEDYKLKGIIRLNASRTSLEGGIIYKDLTKRLDKSYSLQRFTNQVFNENPALPQWIYKTNALLGIYKLSYPLDEVRSIRASAIGVLDELQVMATDINNGAVPVERDILGGVRLAYVYDNTRIQGFNLLEGTRYKLFGEYYQEVTQRESDMKVIGFDFRHYQHIYRKLTFAFRGAGTTSFGGRTILNVLGGLDNELIPQQGDATISNNQNYYYLSQNAPMRGFFQNSRNGTSLAVINSELRWPLFEFFSKKPLNSEFTKTLQFTLFSDVGSAWTGPQPYSDENDFNQISQEANPVSVSINNNREPIIWSYGLGMRAKILGYFVRADYGWGVDDGEIQSGVLHLSLNLDF